jgi:hypothetical protein
MEADGEGVMDPDGDGERVAEDVIEGLTDGEDVMEADGDAEMEMVGVGVGVWGVGELAGFSAIVLETSHQSTEYEGTTLAQMESVPSPEMDGAVQSNEVDVFNVLDECVICE